MASGKVVVNIIREMPTGSSYATVDTRAGGSSPTETVFVFDFDASSVEYVDYLCYLSSYDGGGLTFTLPWTATSATSGVTRWGIAIRRMNSTEDIDTAQTYDYNDVDSTANATSGALAYPTISFTSGSDMDSWANDEFAIVRVRRNASHGNDTMAGDAELWGIIGKET